MHAGTLHFLVRRLHGDQRPLTRIYRDAIDIVVHTEKLGFDFALSGEHHFMPTQWNPSPLMLLAAIAQHTSRIRLGTLVLLTPFYEPVRLSEDLATLDILSNGRLDIAFGTGSIGFEFETFRVDPRQRTGRMWETMEIVRRSFAEEEFDHLGKYFKIPHLRQTTKPIQDPFPIWYGGFGPKNLERAGREGYHVQVAATPTKIRNTENAMAINVKHRTTEPRSDPQTCSPCSEVAALVISLNDPAVCEALRCLLSRAELFPDEEPGAKLYSLDLLPVPRVAKMLFKSEAWVRRHKCELGVVTLGGCGRGADLLFARKAIESYIRRHASPELETLLRSSRT